MLPFFTLARALYVEPLAQPNEIVLQPRIGALDVRTEAGRTVVTVRGAMPLVTTTTAEAPERIQLAFAGLGSSLAPSRRIPGAAVDTIGVTVGGSARVPTTTITIDGVRGATHRVLPSGSPDAYTVVFEARATVAAGVPPPPPPLPGAGAATPLPESPPGSGHPARRADCRAAQRRRPRDRHRRRDRARPNDAVIVRVALSAAATYDWHRLNDNRWYVDFHETTLNGPGRDEHPSFGAVSSLRIRQQGSTDTPVVRVAFTLTGQQRIDLTPSESGLLIAVAQEPAIDLARTGSGRTGGAPVVASAASPTPSTRRPGSSGSTPIPS